VGQPGAQGQPGVQGQRGLPGVPGPRAAFTAYTPTLGYVNFAGTWKSIGTISLPAGSYVVFAKGWAENLDQTNSAYIQCMLAAGGDTDETATQLAPASNIVAKDSLALNMVHVFAAPGSANLSCIANGSSSAEIFDVRITAIQVGSATTTTLLP
jgi:hypothetical protein